MLQFNAYRLAIRKDFDPIHHGKKLFQQYLVDAYVKVEAQCLDFIRRNQQQLRVGKYHQLSNKATNMNLPSGKDSHLTINFSRKPTLPLAKLSGCNGNDCQVWEARFIFDFYV